MRRCAGLLLAVWFALAAPVQAQPQSQPLDIGSDPALLARAALGSDPGSASVAVLRCDQLRVATVQRPAADAAPQVARAGPAGLAPLCEIGSISKVFTGLLLAQAVERGELSLSDTLGQRPGGFFMGGAPTERIKFCPVRPAPDAYAGFQFLPATRLRHSYGFVDERTS